MAEQSEPPTLPKEKEEPPQDTGVAKSAEERSCVCCSYIYDCWYMLHSLPDYADCKA